MSGKPEPSLCPGCSEIEIDCVCWVAEQDAWDPILIAAFERHEPPLDLPALCTRTELGETGCLIEVMNDLGWITLPVYFDDETGLVYLVPGHVLFAEEMAELVRDDYAALVCWSELPPGSAPELLRSA
ncbi:MAG: hypothetical protein JWM76_2109 [Pseudonocardiales bacterium]|nr:hypothetical protein [Pseudonocardiales bacterium]